MHHNETVRYYAKRRDVDYEEWNHVQRLRRKLSPTSPFQMVSVIETAKSPQSGMKYVEEMTLFEMALKETEKHSGPVPTILEWRKDVKRFNRMKVAFPR